ncbi:hypothetical protein TWF696_004351 [Orbilia brochopaga]|uniref:Zn(2)-C6 fungal-type domain-containing protein n=1 Tax=Orbilia brochopaga TaxID=3140254 RepID=A0AAV9V5V3_9PEZI
MTRTTRQSVGRSKADEEMPPPPPPSTATTTTAATKPPAEDNQDAAAALHKRIRSPLLEKVFDRAVKASLSGVTPEAWNKCFPTPTAKRPEQMREVRKKFCEIYELNVRKNFEDIIATRKLLAALDNLDILIAEAQSRRSAFESTHPAPPPAPAPSSSPSTKQESSQISTKQESSQISTEQESSQPGPPPASQPSQKEGEAEPSKNPDAPLPLHEFTPQDLYTSHLHPLLTLQSARLTNLLTAQQSSIDTLITRRESQQSEIRSLIATLEQRLAVVSDAAGGVKEILEMDDEMEVYALKSTSRAEDKSAWQNMRQRSSPRLTVACEPCKRKKRKCNGASPFCSTCSRTPSACHYVRPNPRGLPPGYLIALEQRLADTEAALRQSIAMILELIHSNSNSEARLQSTPLDIYNVTDDDLMARKQSALKYLESRSSLRERALGDADGRQVTPDGYPEKRERQAEWEKWPLQSMADVFSWWSREDRDGTTNDREEEALVVDGDEVQDVDDPPSASFGEVELDDTPGQPILGSSLRKQNRHQGPSVERRNNPSNRQPKGQSIRRYGTSKTPRRNHPVPHNMVSGLSANNLQEPASPGVYVTTTIDRVSDEGMRYQDQALVNCTINEQPSRKGLSDNVRRLLDLNPGWF